MKKTMPIDGKFELMALPYAPNALEPVISAQTLQFLRAGFGCPGSISIPFCDCAVNRFMPAPRQEKVYGFR